MRQIKICSLHNKVPIMAMKPTKNHITPKIILCFPVFTASLPLRISGLFQRKREPLLATTAFSVLIVRTPLNMTNIPGKQSKNKGMKIKSKFCLKYSIIDYPVFVGINLPYLHMQDLFVQNPDGLKDQTFPSQNPWIHSEGQ